MLTAGRSVSHARLAAALGGGGSRGPTRGAGSGGAASRGASPRLPMEKVIVFSQVGLRGDWDWDDPQGGMWAAAAPPAHPQAS